jgi:fumarate reductase flavoprotein subunit
MQISNLGTLGGVRVSEKLEALNEGLKPVPGLYVVGNDAGGFYGNITSYPPYEGLATGFAVNSGKIGGRAAAEFALGK